jgi:polysaccharide deacetylase 2 family uncharacterized protein YibQ
MRRKVAAARNRKANRSGSRAKTSRRLIALSSYALLLLLAFLVLFRLSGCRRNLETAQKRTAARRSAQRPTGSVSNKTRVGYSEAELQGIAFSTNEAIMRAAGSEVWIKGFRRYPSYELADAARTPLPSGRATPVEILAVGASFKTALFAAKQSAMRQNLRMHLSQPLYPSAAHLIEIELSGEKGPAGTWRLREVPRLFRAAILIDDLGQNQTALSELLKLRYPITFSVLPHLRYSRETAEEIHRAGGEVMLHLPMEPEPGRAALGTGVIRVGMADSEVAQTLDSDLASIAFARGVNNHEGSRATADPRLMLAVMRSLAHRRLFFIDSRTTAGTVAYEQARRVGVPSFFRSIFLDNTPSVPYTLAQLDRFCRVVKDRGAAVAIGHPHASTIAALRQYLPEFEREDIQLVPASQLVRLPDIARLSPPRPAAQTAESVRQ